MNLINQLNMQYLIEKDGKMCGQRFGQWFINNYIKDSTTDAALDKAFYEQDHNTCGIIIQRWLNQNCYYDKLPVRIA
jgi:hypothetical protein